MKPDGHCREPRLQRRSHTFGKFPREARRRLTAEFVLCELDDLIVLVGAQEAGIEPRGGCVRHEHARREEACAACTPGGRQELPPRLDHGAVQLIFVRGFAGDIAGCTTARTTSSAQWRLSFSRTPAAAVRIPAGLRSTRREE